MNFAVAATALVLVIPAELPDKTFISCVVISSRYRPLPVWIGAASALVLQAAIAVVAGRLLDLLPHRAVLGVVTALFLAGAAYLLFVPEKSERRRGEELADEAPAPVPPVPPVPPASASAPLVPAVPPSDVRLALSTFGIVALAEFGDITQVLITDLAAKYRDPVSVFAGAAVAFCLVAAVGVLAGRFLTRHVPLALVRRASGLALLGLGIYTLVGLVTG